MSDNLTDIAHDTLGTNTRQETPCQNQRPYDRYDPDDPIMGLPTLDNRQLESGKIRQLKAR